MFDKELIKLLGTNKKYVVHVVLLMILGMLANIGITASICWGRVGQKGKKRLARAYLR